MNNYISFLTKHWALVLLLVLTVIAIAIYELFTQVLGTKRVNPQEAINIINNQDGVIIDTRNQKLFREGHIINSTNIIPSNFESELKKLLNNQNKPIIVIGETDQSAIETSKKMLKSGFKSVQILAGGLNAWKTASLPLEKD